ncbi:DUF6922 domain-containing protein [Pedobacter frigidisoli]|uniref:DUF6922 domain-containing protein n=1 Tax=Pedobacter frigidisoli TaxID=2530455 RepID=UPI002930A85B|nr:hypothetical protein [Pedobacter frigidisoli]
MRPAVNISEFLPEHLFWDVNVSTLDVVEDKDFIIPRALFATTEDTFDEDITLLEQLYNRSEIVSELRTTKERISNSVCTLVARRYHVKHFSRY